MIIFNINLWTCFIWRSWKSLVVLTGKLLVVFEVICCSVVGANTNGFITSAQETKFQLDTVHLSCFSNYRVIWGVNNRFQRLHIKGYGDEKYRKIYADGILQAPFMETGRYSVSASDGFYNLTIRMLNISEAGKYVCHEDLGNGPAHSTQLSVLGKIFTFCPIILSFP